MTTAVLPLPRRVHLRSSPHSDVLYTVPGRAQPSVLEVRYTSRGAGKFHVVVGYSPTTACGRAYSRVWDTNMRPDNSVCRQCADVLARSYKAAE